MTHPPLSRPRGPQTDTRSPYPAGLTFTSARPAATDRVARVRSLAVAAAVFVFAPAAHAAAPRMHPCRDAAPGARCGYVTVPLDRAGSTDATLRIEFELYRRRDRGRPSLGTMVDVEGGPGYSTTDSRSYYLALHRPLMARRDLLLVDARGTGLSGALDCPALRRTVADYVRRAGRCAAQLGPRVDLYGTRAVVDDLATVLDALRIPAVDFYGDSYGTYVGQAFAVRHGDRLRSLVLDGAYPLPGTDPAFGDLAEASWRGLRLACERRPVCGEDPLAALQRLVSRVRNRPVSGRGTDTDGNRIRVRIDETSLATVVQSAYGNLTVYRDLVAAIHAFEAGDRAPLLRLVAESTLDPAASPVRGFSEALYLAVTCHDYPQLWDPAASLADRRTQLAQARAALPAERFAPFSPTVWTALDYEGATACLRWPGPRRDDPPAPPGAPYPAVPTLVINGDLDNITASSGALVVAARFPRSTFVEMRNTIHVSALGDRSGCAAPLVRRFIRTLDAGDTSCAGRIAEVRVVDRFRRRAAPGAAGVAAAAAATVADALQRWTINYSGGDRGLRGGRWSYTGTRLVRFRFRGARFARDVPVSGTATWRLATGAVHARLRVARRGHLRVRWNLRQRLARATFRGTIDGRHVRATMPAP